MNILFTSVGRRSYLVKYFRKALAQYGGEIHVMNSTAISPVFQIADKATISPLIYDENYIPFLLEYCLTNKIKAVIPLLDIDLFVLASNKEMFEEIGTKLIVSDRNVIDICNDKWKTYQFLICNGFNAPATYLLNEDAVASLQNGEIEFPVMIKPRWGMGSIEIYSADNYKELAVLYAKAKRNVFHTVLKYESSYDAERCLLIQERLNGQEYGMDIMNDLDGELRNVVVKKKQAMRSGETDSAVTVESEALKACGTRISKTLRHIGNLDVDAFTVGEKIYVLEMNARFGGGYPFSHIAGVDLPLAIIKWLHGESVDASVLEAQIGVMGQKDIELIKLENQYITRLNQCVCRGGGNTL